MTFDTDQMSVSDSAPVELYQILTPQTTYYRTTFQEDYVDGGFTYTRIPGMRSEIIAEATGKANDLVVELPSSDLIILDNFVGVPPLPRTTMKLTLYRLQQLSGAKVLWWEGPIRGMSMHNNGRVARLHVPDGVDDALRTELPRARCQRKCNNGLYDPNCTKLETDFDHATTVASFSGNTVTVNTTGDPGATYYKDGYMIFNGERRGIVDQSGGTFKTLHLDAAFRGIGINSNVTILAGCDKNVTTCRDKFNNVINFRGLPGLPTKNLHARSYR